MNTPRVAVALAAGLLLSGTCTWLISRKLTAPSTAVPVQRYVAPSRLIEPGETLKADSLELVSWPANMPVDAGFTKPDGLIGRTVVYPLGKGLPISEKYLTPAGTGVGLAWKIPAGMRAIALQSNEVMGVAGFLMPGSHVDVLVTLRSDKLPEPTTFTTLQDVEVLATGHETKPDPDGKPSTVTVVTLLLTPEDAEKAVLASLQGTVHFVLRSGTDGAKVDDAPVALTELMGHPVKPAANANDGHAPARRHAGSNANAPRPVYLVPPPKPTVVETISGDKSTYNTFTAGGPVISPTK
jgi:pilus assembly protein CpaB